MIALTLMTEGFEVHVPKDDIYFAMAFSFAVELVNMRMLKKRRNATLHLQKRIVNEDAVC